MGVPKRRQRRASVPAVHAADGYAALSQRPLHILVFLAPLLALYEVGSLVYLTDPTTGIAETISAYSIIGRAFSAFGVAGFALPAAVLVGVLFIWHALVRDPWRIKPGVLGGMGIESAAWTLPLLVAAVLIAPGPAMQVADGAGAPPPDTSAWPWQARLTLAVGAGLYEELLFRLLLIPVVVLLLRDLFRLQLSSARLGAIGISALLFALYHDLGGPDATIDPSRLIWFLAAGAFFGGLFLWRGFGIAVGVHALYDIVALVLVG